MNDCVNDITFMMHAVNIVQRTNITVSIRGCLIVLLWCVLLYNARSNATLFDNRQQNNSECQWWHRGGRADVWLTVFYFDKVPTGCQVSNAGTDVCARVCASVCVRACACASACMCVCASVCVCVTRSLQLFPYTSRINFKHLLSY